MNALPLTRMNHSSEGSPSRTISALRFWFFALRYMTVVSKRMFSLRTFDRPEALLKRHKRSIISLTTAMRSCGGGGAEPLPPRDTSCAADARDVKKRMLHRVVLIENHTAPYRDHAPAAAAPAANSWHITRGARAVGHRSRLVPCARAARPAVRWRLEKTRSLGRRAPRPRPATRSRGPTRTPANKEFGARGVRAARKAAGAGAAARALTSTGAVPLMSSQNSHTRASRVTPPCAAVARVMRAGRCGRGRRGAGGVGGGGGRLGPEAGRAGVGGACMCCREREAGTVGEATVGGTVGRTVWGWGARACAW